MGHRAALLAVLGLVANAGCGDNIVDPFVGLVRVTGKSPFATSCSGSEQRGVNFPGMEVEPSLASNPTRAGHLVAAWQQDRWGNGGASGIGTAVSFDGGITWTLSSPPHVSRCNGGNAGNGGDYERATDPWLTFAADGTVFLSALAFDNTSSRNAMVASRSVDGGMTWSAPTVLHADNEQDVFNDKETITADPTDPGRVYAVWDRLTRQTQTGLPGSGPTWFARTTDGAWEPSRLIFDPGIDAQTIGNVIVVLPDGTLVNVFDLITQTSGDMPVRTVAAIRSTDKGQSWSPAIPIAPLRAFGVQDPDNHVFVRSGTPLLATAVDHASGALYVAWQGAPPGSTVDGIALASSVDGGLTWSAPAYLNGAPDVAAFTPTMAVAPDGTVGVMYYDLRDPQRSGTTFRATPWLATSHDGGRTWSDEALSDPFDLRPARIGDLYFLGDYHGLAVSSGAFVPLFVASTKGDDDRTSVFVRPTGR